ncbi:MAG: hypothetical protein J7M40_01285 [Planctomycetes bacterium]|nr:hypothetical protein [Planctomycetota bacterium]
MEVVFFIYGLGFFILGFAITLSPKKNSTFALAKHLYLIAVFGFLHGINEWLDMFILIYQSSDTMVLEIARAATLPTSFLCLVHFGARVIPLSYRRLGSFRLLTPVLNYHLFDEHLGVPVQVFRTVCSVAMAFGIVRILSIFRWETRTELRRYRDEMAKTHQMAAQTRDFATA